MEITATEQNIEKRMKRNEDSQRDLWDNIKCTNIHTLAKIFENIFEGITWERKQPIMSRKHRVPGRINPRGNTPRHLVIKLTEIKDKGKIVKATREK